MNQIITEITPLSQRDCFYLVDRYKDQFNYPLHRHDEYELNFVANCSGARRVVGDSIETVGEYDLALIGNGIEHCWEQHECSSKPIREITIQFSSKLFGETFLSKNQMTPIRELLAKSASGLCFDMEAIMNVYGRLQKLTQLDSGFMRMIELLLLLYELATTGKSRSLASSSFAQTETQTDSRRVQRVRSFINEHYAEEIRLGQLAELVGMTPTAFSRFFKLRTGRVITDYIIDIRLGHASRRLVDSTMSVSEICYECGFNNVSYFNRLFKRQKGCSPKEFRETYKRNKVVV